MSWNIDNLVTQDQLKSIVISVSNKTKALFVTKKELKSTITELETTISNLTARVEALEQNNTQTVESEDEEPVEDGN